MFRSLPSFWMYLYNQIQATNCPIVEITEIQIAEYPISHMNPINPMNMYPEFQVETADSAAKAGCMPLPATR